MSETTNRHGAEFVPLIRPTAQLKTNCLFGLGQRVPNVQARPGPYRAGQPTKAHSPSPRRPSPSPRPGSFQRSSPPDWRYSVAPLLSRNADKLSHRRRRRTCNRQRPHKPNVGYRRRCPQTHHHHQCKSPRRSIPTNSTTEPMTTRVAGLSLWGRL